MADRFKMCTDLSSAFQNLGFIGDVSFHKVSLLGRLHHRNLVNLVGYCAEKGQHMLVYVYMSKGSLSSHLYNVKHDLLSWSLRVQIALDVARGLEYLHDGAVPSVVHRDIKPSNILLDQSMGARVADFGLSRRICLRMMILDQSIFARVADFGPVNLCKGTSKKHDQIINNNSSSIKDDVSRYSV